MKPLGPKMSKKIHQTVSRYRGVSNSFADTIDDSLRLLPATLFPASHSLAEKRAYNQPPVCRLVSQDLGVRV